VKVEQPRVSPVWRNVILAVGFVALVVVGVLTVLLPELEEEPAEESPSGASDEPGETVADDPSE